jgi:hypothetical protein
MAAQKTLKSGDVNPHAVGYKAKTKEAYQPQNSKRCVTFCADW